MSKGRLVLRAAPWLLTAFALAGSALGATGLLDRAAEQIVLVAAMTAACLIPVAAATARGRLDVFEIGVFIGFAYLVLFPLRAIVVLTDADFAANQLAITASRGVERTTLVVATLGFVALGVAYNSGLGSYLSQRFSRPHTRWLDRPSLPVSVGIFAVGLAAQSLVVVANRTAGRVDIGVLGGSRLSGLVTAATVLLLVGLAMLTVLAFHRGRVAKSALVAAIIVVVALGLVGKMKEITLLALVVPLVTAHFTLARGLRAWWVLVAAVVALYFVFPLVQASRYASARVGSSNPIEIARELPTQLSHYSLQNGGAQDIHGADYIRQPLLVASRRLGGYDALAISVRQTPQAIPFQRGEQSVVRIASGAVPRVLWPEKPGVGIGFWFGENYWSTPPGARIVAQAVAHPANLWIDFGPAGVVIGLVLLGAFYRFAYEWLRPRASATGAIVYAVVLVTVADVDRDLPLVYVTLLQRLVGITALVIGLELLTRGLRIARRALPQRTRDATT